jgi:alpha-mannosidase
MNNVHNCFAGFLTLLLSTAAASGQNTPAALETPPPEIYFTPFSHLDFFWGGTREECLARGNGIIAQAIRLANQSPKFRFLLEDNVFVANFVDTHSGSSELADLKRLVKDGRIELAPKWAAIFQGLPDGEVHARNLAFGKRYARDVFGVDTQVAHLGDLPDYTPQFPQILKQSRVPFMVMTRMGPADKSLFFWKSPDGSRALVWNTLKGYGWGTFLSSKTQLDEQKRERFRKDLADVRATTDGAILMNWGTDLWSPPDDLVDRVESFNQSAPARLIISTPSDFFRRAEKQSNIPELSGEIPSSWPNIVSSLAHIWPQIVPATSTLLAAEKFATINYALGYAPYPQREFDFLWKKLIESMDHNHDGQGGAIGDNRKIGYMQLALLHGGEILRDSLRNLAERVQIPFTNSFPIVVFNPLGWTRDDLVKTHLTLYGPVSPADIAPFKKGMRLLDDAGHPVPFHLAEYSENISRALELVFVARGVPSLGYKTYYLTATETPEVFPPAATVNLDDDKDRREPRRPLGTNTIENSFYRLSVDRTTGRATLWDKALNRDVCRGMEIAALEERGGNYIGIEPPSGRSIFSLVDSVVVEETNAVRAVVRIASRIGDIPITQRLTLYQDLKRLDIENTIEWKTPRFIRVHQLFPLTQPNASIRYGVPFGANASDNIIPNAGTHASDEIPNEDWKRSRHIHDWLHAGAADWGLTIASDHQQIRLDEDVVRAEMVRGTRFTSVKVVRGNEVTSLNYPPPGAYVFRYSLSSSSGDWKTSKAYRTGLGWNNPLLPVSVCDGISAKSLPPVRSFCSVKPDSLVVSALKKSDLGPSILLRVYEIEGASVETPVEFLGRETAFNETNLLEEDQASLKQRSLQAGPYSIKTLKLDVTPAGARQDIQK